MDRSNSADALRAAIVASTDEAIMAIDRSGTGADLEPASEALYGYTATDVSARLEVKNWHL